MDQLFSNREIAVSIWLLIILFWAVTNKEVRESIKQVISCFCHRTILTIFTLMGGYVYLIADFMSSVGLWNIDQLKNTIMWFIFVASVELFKVNTIHEQKGYFKNSIKGHFKLLVALEFIIALHSFSLVAELVIVPLTTLVAILLAMSEREEKYKSVETIMSWLLSIFGVFLVIFGFYFIYTDFEQFAQSKTLMDFSTPIILSILLLPFLFLTSVYSLYESILIRVNIYTDNRFYRFYAKLKSLIHFKTDHKSLNNWIAYSCMSDFENRESINKSIQGFESKNI